MAPERWIEVIAQVTRDEAGHPLRMSGVNLDITTRKMAELATLKARARAEALAEATRVLTEPDLPRETVLTAIAQQAAVQVGDLAVFRLLSADGGVVQAVAVAHPDTAAREGCRESTGGGASSGGSGGEQGGCRARRSSPATGQGGAGGAPGGGP